MKDGARMRGPELAQIATEVWRASHPDSDSPPKFEFDFRRDFNARFPELAFNSNPIKAVDIRRFKAATEGNVRQTERKLKTIIRDLHCSKLNEPQGYAAAWRIITIDEVGIEAKSKTSGTPALGVGMFGIPCS